MQALHEILQRLTPEERTRLQDAHGGRANVISKLIADALDDSSLTKDDFIARHDITVATYNKSKSQAIDTLYRELSGSLNNPYDPILLIRLLLYRGLVKEAKKQFSSLEKEYSRQRLYSVLDILYHEAMRICYHTGDTKWLEQLIGKIKANSADLLHYNELDAPLILQMLKLEKKGSEEKSPVSAGELEDLRQRAEKLGHPVLVHNSFYCLYAYYTQHHFDVEKAHRAARNVLENTRRHSDSLNAYAIMIAYNNYAHFLCMYSVDESPEEYYDLIAGRIGMGGPLEAFDFYFNYFQFYFFSGNRRKADAMLRKMIEMPEEVRFAILVHVASAWMALGREDANAFRKEFTEFYASPSYQDFPEHEFHLRVMEILFALREEQLEYAEQKMEALRKFHYRKFQPAEDYRVMVNALQRAVYARLQGSKGTRRSPETQFSLRSLDFLHTLLEKEKIPAG